MDASDLRVFESVARLGGMSRAAAELNTVQSNVTARIRVLEEQLGTELFERHSRGVTLTAAGRRLMPYALQVISLLKDARRAVGDLGEPSGDLVIGSLETTLSMHLAPLLTTFVERWPRVDLSIRGGTTRESVEHVLERRLEGAFVCGPVSHPDLVEETVFREELVVLTAPSIGRLDWSAGLAGLRIVVLRLGCSYRQRLEDILARRGVVGLRLLEFGTLEAIFGCVAAGMGITLLPRRMVERVWRGRPVGIHTLPPDEALVDTVYVRRRDSFVSSAQSAFLDHVRHGLAQAQAAE
ncbi:transcriptional regulator [Magnetospirillum sp. ME-1]|uniref:LysR family transcriptional regulator n=1 Tax=Magnetospirillum sp. ME-1 TaxID=1639348 RepID=UPI000A17AB05|nr:LysR family transcriptional regulator [Magnetospirillum sp. ME-1]ARJ68085.1 transcriptional regulator [Magnetospirillum sp. ME-1]